MWFCILYYFCQYRSYEKLAPINCSDNWLTPFASSYCNVLLMLQKTLQTSDWTLPNTFTSRTEIWSFIHVFAYVAYQCSHSRMLHNTPHLCAADQAGLRCCSTPVFAYRCVHSRMLRNYYVCVHQTRQNQVCCSTHAFAWVCTLVRVT